ncbi:HDR126Cp [Eremothecium sinecaudum]|uniref:HDR126Cp n=1 Tax=Eremothecium sinecaudum TaxID=45286 RepID=A0A120K298_9SACH|nr:HDR126Cp [Eremothecium sinecaudum]AMD20868.1 HDR126Cp [Eremothecium sinecaudum]
MAGVWNSHDSDEAQLLGNETKKRPKRKQDKKKQKPRRRSVFQNGSSDEHHEVFAPSHGAFGADNDRTDSWGLLHDTDDESTTGVYGGHHTLFGFGTSYIDHRPSMAMLEATHGGSGGSTVSQRRPSTVPHNGNSGAPSADSQHHHAATASARYRDPTAPAIPDHHSTGRRRSTKGITQPVDNWRQNLKDYGSIPSYPAERNTEEYSRSRGGDVVIDMDELMEHVRHKRDQEQQMSKHDSDVETEEYNSQPSSRGSSASSSLDDVCLPIDEDNARGLKQWPDVSVIEEFSREEIERLKREALQDAEDFHYQYYNDEDNETTDSVSGIAFTKPIITNIDVPELGNTRVNESEHLHKGRLRPKKLTPWHLKRGDVNLPGLGAPGDPNPSGSYSEMVREDFLVGRNIQYPPRIISNNPEIFRFTYFREDLDSTVHSPTISGLLQPGQKFEDLFVGSCYSSNSQSSAGEHNVPSNANTTNAQVAQAAHAASALLESHTPVENKSLSPCQAPSAIQQSQSWELNEVLPFWLDVLNPTEEEMKVLSKTFGIHPLTTEDIFLGEVREKVELFKDYYLVCFRSFDIVAERSIRKKRQMQVQESVFSVGDDASDLEENRAGWLSRLFKMRRRGSSTKNVASSTSSYQRKAKRKADIDEKYKRKSGDRRRPREGELEPLNVYIIVFRNGVLTFHFAPTPHPINVRRRARLLKDYVNVTADWIAYALIDDITDAFAPMIELIEDEVYNIEDSILKMHQVDDSSDSSDSDSDSTDDDVSFPFDRHSRRTAYSRATKSTRTSRSSSTSSSTINANIMGWKKKGDMLRRIGECRKRVMSIVRLLGSKADVIKGFSKRCNEQWEVAPRSEIAMYLGDIQDHIVTMVSSLNHYEKLLSRSHSNYLAQINIDMTKVNNDMNDVLGKITILGTIFMPMNIITGLWGMNVIVPGQFSNSLQWFVSIALSMLVLAYLAYVYTRRRFGF